MMITNAISSLRSTRAHRLFDRLLSVAGSRNSLPSFNRRSFVAFVVVLGVSHTDSLALHKH
jgi:hypothetical protein